MLTISMGHYVSLELRVPRPTGVVGWKKAIKEGFLDFNLKGRFNILLYYPLSITSNG